MDTIASLFPGPPAPAATQPTIGIYEGRFSRAPSTHTDGA
ncbi:MAG: hypothetical protein JWM31_1253, partial [Solirubrobacterales bacterium]|nr:hypothetical protein [Solirubrobacterales bacterium]